VSHRLGFAVKVLADGGLPSAATTAAPARALPPALVSGTATICQGGSTPISAALTGTGPWSLTWSDGVVQSAGVSPATRNVSPVWRPTRALDSGWTASWMARRPSPVANSAPKPPWVRSGRQSTSR